MVQKSDWKDADDADLMTRMVMTVMVMVVTVMMVTVVVVVEVALEVGVRAWMASGPKMAPDCNSCLVSGRAFTELFAV